jgi:hypothetical protein
MDISHHGTRHEHVPARQPKAVAQFDGLRPLSSIEPVPQRKRLTGLRFSSQNTRDIAATLI